MAASLSSSYNLLQHLRWPPVPRPPPSASSSLFPLLLKPLSAAPATVTAALPISTTISTTLTPSKSLLHTLTSKSLLVCRSSLSLRRSLSSSSAAFTQTPSLHQEDSEDDEDLEEDEGVLDEDDSEEFDDVDDDYEEEELEEEEERIVAEAETVALTEEAEPQEPERGVSARPRPATEKPPTLSVKEKKELASYAHSLGKKLKSQLVGKSGVTDNVAAAFVENLESNELLKIKIHSTCPGELDEVVEQLQVSTGSVVVSQIGRTIIIYRPSLTKMKAEEKKRQARRVFVRKESQFKPKFAIPRKGPSSRMSSRGRRGSSRAMRPAATP